MKTFSVKNFEKFQHYKDRSPPWIKLYNGLLEDYEFGLLPDASKMHLIAIWLLASRSDNKIPFDAKWVAGRINATEMVDLELLAERGFIVLDQGVQHVASKPPAERLSREEGQVQDITETEKNSGADAPRARADKSPKKASKPIPDDYLISERVSGYATTLGLSSSEIAREHTKFCNHAKQTDRRCAEWEPAEETWMIGAAERLGKQPASSSSTAPNWEVVLEMYKRTGHWSKWAGPDPDSPACQAPRGLLEKYGIPLPSSSATEVPALRAMQ